MADEIKIELVADANGVIRAIKQAEKPAGDAGLKIGESIKGGIKKAGIGAAVAAGFGGAAVLLAAKQAFTTFKQGLADATVQAESVNKLNNALATTGQFSAKVSKDLQNFASELQSVTTFGDEALIGQMAFAQSMGASAEQSKQIVKAAADMATALDMDLNAAVRNISKTLGGYGGELSEVIPALKNLTKEQLQAGGGVTLLEEQFRKFAELSANTVAGRIKQLKNSVGDLSEKVGESVVNSDFFVIALGMAREALDTLVARVDLSVLVEGIKGIAMLALKAAKSVGFLATGFAKLTGNQDLVKFFGETSVQMMNLEQRIKGITAADVERAKIERENSLIKLSNMKKEAELQTIRNAQSEYEKHLAQEKVKANKAMVEAQQKELTSFKNSIKNQFVGGMVTAFSSFGKAMATGGNAFKDFGSSVLGMIGSLATQLGQFFILVGAAMSATTSLMGLSGGAAIAAGIGLTVLGGVLQGMAGGGGGAGSVATTSAGGGVVESDATLVNTTGDVTGINDPEAIERQQQVQLVVEGSIFNTEETSKQIIDLLNEEFDSKGGRIAYA